MVGTPRQHRLLQEIERGALDSGGTPIADVLRRVVILGGQVGSAELRDWASRELTGYPAGEDVPAYRMISLQCLYDFVGPFGRGGKRLPLSPSAVPEAAREGLFSPVRLPFSIARLEEMAAQCRRSGEPSSITSELGEKVVQAVNDHQRRREGQYADQYLSIYWSLDEAAIRGVLDDVRTKLTGMIAEIVAELPEDARNIPPAVATQAWNVVVNGGSRVQLAAPVASHASAATVELGSPDSGSWNWGHALKVAGIAISGVLTVAALFFAIMQAQGWRIGEPSPKPSAPSMSSTGAR